MKKENSNALKQIATLSACLACIDGAYAASNTIEEVVVTAMRRSQNLQDVPLSVSAISSNQLSARGISLTSDLAAIAPNVNVNSQYGDTQPNFTIRGVGVANEFNVNAASPVGVYVDDLYKSFRFTHGQSLFDLERVEALRGPQGTLFGRNTTGGAINLITKKPELGETTGYVTGSEGNYKARKIEGAIDTTLVDNVLGVRIAGIRSTRDGYFDEVNPANSLRGKDKYQSSDYYVGRVNVRYQPNDKLDIVYSGQYGYEDPIGPARTSYGVVPDGSGGFTDFGGYSRFNDLLIGGKDDFHMNDMGKFITRSRSNSLTIVWSGESVTFTSLTGLTDGFYNLEDESDGSPLQLVGINYKANTEDFSQDFRINVDTDNMKFIVGAYYGSDELRASNQLNFFGFFPDATSPLDFNGGGANPLLPPTSFRVLQTYGQDRTSKAIYGELNYDITEKFDLTIGLRHTQDEIEYINGNSFVWSNFETGASLFPLFTDINQQDESKKVSGRLIANYAFTDDVSGYISFSRGQRSGTYNGFAYADPSQVFFVPPEQLDSYEAGIKSLLLEKTLQLNVAVFHYEYEGQQVQEIKGVVGFLTSVDAKVDGAEIELQYKPIDRLTIHSSLGFLDAKYADGSLISGIDIGGNQLPFAPEVTANIGFDYSITTVGDAEIVWTTEAQYSDDVWWDIFNDDQLPPPGFTRQIELKQEAYTLVNTRLSYITDSFTLSLWGKNIFDKTYYPAGYNVEGGTGMDFSIRGTPSTYGLDLTYNF